MGEEKSLNRTTTPNSNVRIGITHEAIRGRINAIEADGQMDGDEVPGELRKEDVRPRRSQSLGGTDE